MNKIITVGREFGSGGRELGRRLAEELGIEYYDKEIISEIAKNTSLSEKYIRSVVEGKPHSLFPITIGNSFAYNTDYHVRQIQEIFKAQTEIISSLADKSRIRRCRSRQDGESLTDQELKRRILAIDKDRARYYNDFTGQRWGDKSYYDFCINTTDVVIKEIVPYIAKMF